MRHRATPRFWRCYHALPAEIRRTADTCHAQLVRDPRHPSLQFKRVGRYWSVRVGLQYRALALVDGDGLLWIWIGTHAEYDGLIGGR